MTPIQIIGIGLDGLAGLPVATQQLIAQASIIAGSDRHLSYIPITHPAQRWSLVNLADRLQQYLVQSHSGSVVVLTSGDPLFFGLGRQLLEALPADVLTFHPHISSLQLAFSRVKLPWQEATVISAHGRSLDLLAAALRAGKNPIAVLTDGINTPGAIARLIQSLDLPTHYQLWICENLGGADERVQQQSIVAAQRATFAPLNVVILQRQNSVAALNNLPIMGIPDEAFLSFRDRPGLMTKREVRVQILADLTLQDYQVVWDIGAGTGSVSIEAARLLPHASIWAIEKSAAGCNLIRQNIERFGITNVTVLQSSAPAALSQLPDPHRVFVGGSGGHLAGILDACIPRLSPQGRLVAALATLENLAELTQWLKNHANWQATYHQIAAARSVAVGHLTRWAPLNPVILGCLIRTESSEEAAQLPNQAGSNGH